MARAIDNDNNTGSSTTRRRRTTGGGMPTINLDTTSTNSSSKSNGGNIPSLNLDSTSGSNEKVSMLTGKKVKSESNGREIIDINDMVNEGIISKKDESAGVDVKKSPADEILKEGGPFDKYVEEKKEEMKERMAEEAKKQQEIVEEEKANQPESEEEKDDREEKEILAESHLSRPERIRVNAVARDEDEEVSSDISDDDVFDESEDNDEPTPFYTGLDIKDDFEYPDDYDLPDDIFNEEEDLHEDDEPEEEDEEVIEESIASNTAESSLNSQEEPEQIEETVEESPFVDEDKPAVKATRVAFTTDEGTIEDLEKELEDEVEKDSDLPSEDERLEELKAEVSRKVKPKAQALNLKGFTIATKATASNKILEFKETSAGKWVLPTTGITVQVREISGQKIEYLRENSGSNPTAARNSLKTIYDHIITPKPSSFEAWTKSVAYTDYDHLYMAIYLAAFSDSNYIPLTCVMEQGKLAKRDTGCGKMFLTDNIDIMKMIKFKDDESKKKFWNLYDSDRTNSEGLFASEVVPISHRFAAKFCEPSIYSVLLEMGSYGREFMQKYENTIAMIPYIADLYWINYKTNELVRIDYKKYANNASKTAKSKVIKYFSIFDTLTTDEYTNMVSLINSINERNEWFEYQIPETTCPECKRVIPAETVSAQSLVFSRHRLGLLANTSIK